MPNPFQRATKSKAKLRLALIGPSGSGKSFTSLLLAQRLAEATGGRVAVIDTERGSASLYADLFDFDVLELDTFNPDRYVQALHDAAAAGGYAAVVVDSLSHAWMGKGGALEMVDEERIRSKSGNSFTAWREVTPMHNRLVDAMVSSPLHVIATMRAKMEYVQEKDANGRTNIRKVGLAPIQRDGLEFEFTVVADMDTDLNLVVSKTRVPSLTGKIFPKPDATLADTLLVWLNSGADAGPAKPIAPPVTAGTNGHSAEPLTQHAALTAMNGNNHSTADVRAKTATDDRAAFVAACKEAGLTSNASICAVLKVEPGQDAKAALAAHCERIGWKPARLAVEGWHIVQSRGAAAEQEPPADQGDQPELVSVSGGDPVDAHRGRR